ncbi:MAG: energy transducer TonB [Acidobacteriaceae bacterium]|jgi:protein TonB|nr:energy transducer TonB [Acidobacteriaceae bacterium]
MGNEVLTPPELGPQENERIILHAAPPKHHESFDHLGIGGGLEEEGILASLWTNLHDAFFPPKLPPLVLTSKPIAVPDRMKVKRSPASVATAFAVHALLILLIGFLLAKKILKLAAPPPKVATMVDLNTPIAPPGAKTMGGGGGNNDATPATQGKLPPPVKNPMVPVQHLTIENPKIPAPMSLVMPDNLKLPSNPNLPNFGDPNGPKVSGPGSLGNGGGGGIGNGSGGGLGNGSGGGFGGGVYQVGGGVSAPVLIYSPEAEFTDEARRAKYQGEVDVEVIVGADGLVKNARVLRDPGMGLGQSARTTVMTYRFKPAMNAGKPVPVKVTVNVSFTIY